MATDVPVKHPPVNPCCTVWKDKCSKLEVGRKHLRQAVQILNEQIDKIQTENTTLKKAYEQEQARAETEKEWKDKELAVRVSLENEISALKSEVFSLKQKISAEAEDERGEVKLLQHHVSEAEKEITRLKSLLEKEKIRADSEKKNAEAQKKSAAEAWKHVKTEKAKADEERKLANNEGKKAEEYRLQLEEFRKEVDEEKSKLVSGTLKLEEAVKKLEAEKQKVTKERKRADLEMAKAEEQRKLAEANRKKVVEEKSCAESLSQQLKDAMQRIEELQKEMNSILLSRKLDEAPGYQCNQSEMYVFNHQISSLQRKGSADIKDKTRDAIPFQDHLSEEEKEINQLKGLLQKEKERADSLKKTAEAEKKSASEAWKLMITEKVKADEERKKSEGYQIQLEALRKEADETKAKMMFNILKFEDANKRLVIEKDRVTEERKCTDLEKAKGKELRKLAETNGKSVMEGKSCAGNLSQKSEGAGKRMEELQKEINKFILSRSLDGSPVDLNSNAQAAKMRFKFWLENFMKDADHAELVLEFLKFEDAIKRFEVEKQGIVMEKKHTDTELREVEELRKLVEVNRKMALEEKSRADQLSCQIEESRHKIEELQKQIEELLSYRRVVEASANLPGKEVKTKSRKLKLLERRLKLEKMRLKYAKQVAKLEKIRSSTLQQELGRIKVDSDQISQRLDSLDKWFSSGVECREDLEKDGVSVNMQRSKLKRKFGDLEPSQKYVPKESELKPSCMAKATCYPLSQSLYHKSRLLPACKGDCTESISSIDSQLKSLHEGSYKKMLQSSAINSRSASFSDSKLLDSQEMGAFVSKSEKWVENSDGQTTISGVSGEVTKMQFNENLAVVAENSIRNPLGVDSSRRVNGQNRKWKKMVDAIESIEFLYSEGKKFDVQMEEKLCVLHGMLNREIEKPLDELKLVEASALGGSYAKHERGHKRKAPCDETIIMQHFCSIDEQKEIVPIGNEVLDDANACRHASPSVINQLGIPLECIKGLSDSFESDLAIMERIEKVENGVYMKLLDLDNTADEESYRKALEMPLSPNLPEIEISSADIFDMDKFEAGYSVHGGLSNEKGIKVPSHSFDVVDVEISSKNLTCNALGTSCDELLQGNQGLVNSFDMFGNENGYCNMEIERASDKQTGGDSEVLKISNIPISRDGALKFSSESKLESVHDNIPAYCVVFANTKDSSSVSRIFCATRTCVVHCSLDTETQCMVQKILDVIKWKRNFYPMVSGVDTRSSVAGLGCLNELLHLIEDFLINGQVMVLADVSSETLSEFGSRMNIFLDGLNINMFSKPASADQLVAGSIILASICKAIDRIEIIFEASYNLLRIRKYDIGTMHQHLMELDNLSNSLAKESLSAEIVSCALLVNCDASCSTNKCVMPSDSNCVDSRTLCYLSDVLSLVELLACYMVFNFDIISGCVIRIGVAACGYQDKEVEKLKCKLSGYLLRDSTIRASFPVQIAAITSLLGLMSLNFEDVVQSELRLPEAASQSVLNL
ncbi:hypothetical protein GH714_041230 [Hevea brasiliensis]|uniref:Uncharacterized protein n=1 Tax=Hevea brasiliensis TaxID=3981 RepID=A0A6A6MWN3_HEVBR|nr:hypothetical protein GH714_041230 [Hevea brasiliensis]